MKRSTLLLLFTSMLIIKSVEEQSGKTNQKACAGEPICPGRYAGSEAVVLNRHYWNFISFAASYNQQVHLDAISSPCLVNGPGIPALQLPTMMA